MVIGDKFDDGSIEEPEEKLVYKKSSKRVEKPREDLDAQADEVMRDIELNASSSYVVSTMADAEELDPSEVHAVATGVERDEDLAAADAVDELSEEVEVVQEELESLGDAMQVPQKTEAQVLAHRRRLSSILVFFLIVLLVLGGVIGVFFWRDSISRDVSQNDTEALVTSSAGVDASTIEPVEAGFLPDMTTYFGKTPRSLADASNNRLVLVGDVSKATDKRIKGMEKVRNAVLVDNGGQTVANLAFGLNKRNRIVYIYSSFDLDYFNVADVTFEQLSQNHVVAESLLLAVGVPESAVKSAVLDALASPNAVESSNDSNQEIAKFKGATGNGNAPSSWEVTLTYDHGAGEAAGDNSVMRTLLVELY